MTRIQLHVDVNSTFHLPGKHNQKSHGNRAGKQNNIPAKTSKHAPLSPDATPAQVDEHIDEIYQENADAPTSSPDTPMDPFEFAERADAAAQGEDAFQALTFSSLRQINNHMESIGRDSVGVSYYKEGGYSEINDSLRLGMEPRDSDDPDTQLWERVTNSMDNIMAESKAEEDIIVYRGIFSPERMFGSSWRSRGSNVGLEWQDDGFTSTSVDRNIANQFTDGFEGGVLMRVLVPKGTRAFTPDSSGSTLSEEREIIVDRKSRYRVVRDELEWDDENETMLHFLDVEVVNS